jgi:hypothetical protein
MHQHEKNSVTALSIFFSFALNKKIWDEKFTHAAKKKKIK